MLLVRRQMGESAVIIVLGQGHHLITNLYIKMIRIALAHARQLRHLLQARVWRQLLVHMLIKVKVAPGTDDIQNHRCIFGALAELSECAFVGTLMLQKPDTDGNDEHS